MANNIKIKDVEKLEEILLGDLAWRKKEMLSLKLLIENDKANETILLRAGIALLCAHFEGFIKKASNCYIGYVAEQGYKYKELKNSFAAIKLDKEFASCAKSEKNTVHSRLLDKYNCIAERRFEEKYDLDKPYISTHSNPKVDELREIMSILGIEAGLFETKEKYIDSSLLANRHKVVHGDKTEFNKDDFFSTFSIIMQLMDDYEKLIIKSVEEQKYLK